MISSWEYFERKVILMSKRHTWRIKKEYFNQIDRGEKLLEIRVGYGHVRQVKVGDTISFENYGKNEFSVIRVTRYTSFDNMLSNESVSKVLPGYSLQGALSTLKSIYSADKEALGVYVFELRKKDAGAPKRKIFIASQLSTTSRKLFSRIVAESYNITDWICDDYPKHFEHYWTKYVPGIFKGERQIVAAYIGNRIAGVAILKRDAEETKICTLFISEEFRGQGVATAVLGEAFKWLGTSKPLITIADYKVAMFNRIIEKYDWRLTQVLEGGYYNDHSKEYVYNGKID
jgi:ASC-1-like (ASCH) protein/GNAT superfamily N-acetyltransferase